MDALVEFLSMILEIIFHAVKSNQTNRSIKLIAYAIIFIIMLTLIPLSYIVRDDVFTSWFLIILAVFLAVTLVKSFRKIHQLIRNEEE